LIRGVLRYMNTAPYQQLQAFLAVARHRSFSGAARELGVTRSAVSQAVRQLEEQLRLVLLARTTRSVALTDSGRRLLDGAGPGLGQALAALKEVAARAPAYLARHGVPEHAEDLLRHECITFRSQTTGALYAWELERGRKSWRVPVRGGVVTNDGVLAVSMAELGLGLAYAFEPFVLEQLRAGRLRRVLEPYAAEAPGYFIYFPSRAQRSGPLRLFIEAARSLALRAMK